MGTLSPDTVLKFTAYRLPSSALYTLLIVFCNTKLECVPIQGREVAGKFVLWGACASCSLVTLSELSQPLQG